MGKVAPKHSEGRLFNLAWAALHTAAAVQCLLVLTHISRTKARWYEVAAVQFAMVAMHVGSTHYHWLRVVRTGQDD